MSAGETIPELPDELADRAAERLLGVVGAERDAELAALIATHPAHAAGLRRLHTDLGAAARLLDGTYPDRDEPMATHIDGCRVIRRLGEGAFGIVYLCSQERPVVRRVAIKVLRPGAGDQSTLRRFSAERQVLATLNHPSITQVFDAGEMPDGRPYFVMEYVDGTTLRRHCDERSLSCRERLQLIVALCRGVAHAHTRGIVHRDLKPGNVLVVDTEAGPMPKIIDFGIAKALFASAHGDGPRTDAGRVIGTPGYMSPEQAAGAANEVDGRADVFSLGVMLYELLVRQLPWAQGAAATDTEPVRPSLRITSSTDREIAPARQLAAELRGDLDWITLKALARARDDRYATANALADDIERHLRGEPVSVGPPSPTYRLRKFVRRNRTLVVALGAACTLLLAVLAVAMSYGRSARAEIADAQGEAAANLATATEVVDRLLARANDVRTREAPRSDAARQALLQDALSFYEGFARDRPSDPRLRVGRCRALVSLSHVHWLLGEATRAERAADEAREEAEQLHTADPDDVAYRALLGEALGRQGAALSLARDNTAAQPRFAAAAQHFAVCAERSPELHGRAHATAVRNAAETLPVAHADHESGLRECLRLLEALRRTHPDVSHWSDDYTQACVSLGRCLCARLRFADADALLARTEAELPMVTTDRGRLTSELRQLQATIAWESGERELAMRRMQAALAAATAWQAEQPQRIMAQEAVIGALGWLAMAHGRFDDFEASTAHYRWAVAAAEAMVQRSTDSPRAALGLVRTLWRHAHVLYDRARQVDLGEASTCIARAIVVQDAVAVSDTLSLVPRWQLLALQALIAASRGDAAAAGYWREVDAVLPDDCDLGGQLDFLVGAQTGLAREHWRAGEPAAAARRLATARRCIERNEGHSDKRMVEVGWLEARLAAGRGDHAECAAIARRIQAARGTWFGVRRAADCLHLAWRCAVAASDDAESDYAGLAAELYGRVVKTLEPDVARHPDDPWFVLPWSDACVRSAELLAAAGETTKAIELLANALPRLEAVREAAQRDMWDEDVLRDGRALQVRLAASQPR